MRITSGKARGISLKTIADSCLRPATDYMRQAVFSYLGPLVEGAKVLDLFSGTGSYGLEALSRGATEVVFIEKNKRMIPILEHNIKAVCKSLQQDTSVCSVLNLDALNWKGASSFDLIFADPPYGFFEGSILLEKMHSFACFLVKEEHSRLVLEHPAHLESPKLDLLFCRKRMGKSGKDQPCVSIYSY